MWGASSSKRRRLRPTPPKRGGEDGRSRTCRQGPRCAETGKREPNEHTSILLTSILCVRLNLGTSQVRGAQVQKFRFGLKKKAEPPIQTNVLKTCPLYRHEGARPFRWRRVAGATLLCAERPKLGSLTAAACFVLRLPFASASRDQNCTKQKICRPLYW